MMPRSVEYPDDPEILAHEMPIKWAINSDRLTRLRHNLRDLFERKNGEVYGAITNSREIFLGDYNLRMDLKGKGYFLAKLYVQRKNQTPIEQPVLKEDDLTSDCSASANEINDLISTSFSTKEMEKFLQIILKRIVKTVYATMEKGK